MFAILCWAIWKEICKLTHESRGENFAIQVDWVYAVAENIRKNRLEYSKAGHDVPQLSKQTWLPLPTNHFILDVDAGFEIDAA